MPLGMYLLNFSFVSLLQDFVILAGTRGMQKEHFSNITKYLLFPRLIRDQKNHKYMKRYLWLTKWSGIHHMQKIEVFPKRCLHMRS